MKIIIVIFLSFLAFLGFSQDNINFLEDSIYSELKTKRYTDSLSEVSALRKLKTMYLNEPHNDSIIFRIGEIYYVDFIRPYQKSQVQKLRYNQPKTNIVDSISLVLKEKYFKKSFFIKSADSALYYFKKIKNIDSNTTKELFFAINQLECFVNSDSSNVDLNGLVSPTDYIPYWYLANLDKNWKCDKSKNYLHLIFNSLLITPNTESSLAKMNEPSLYQMRLPNNSEIFRLTYMPSFDDDICIRLEKNNDKVILFWKKSKKKYGSTVGVKSKGQKEISIKIWQYYMQLLEEFDFMNLPNRFYYNMMVCDGASWFFEYKTNTTYKAHYSRIPDRKIEVLALYLLELSGVNYKPNKWEPRYFRYDLILTKDMKYVVTEDIEEPILSCLNRYMDKNINKNKCCCYFDSYLKFNKKGKIRTVRYPYEENLFYTMWWDFQDRKCRKEMKKALKNLDLSYLNLQKPIYYYLKVNYDKENKVFIKEN